MKYPGKTLAAWTLGAALLAACSDGSEQFFIVQNQVPEEGCVIPGNRTALYMGSGVLDVALVGENALVGYQLFPLLQSDLPALGEEGATEPNRLALRELRVRLELAPDAPEAMQTLFAAPELEPYLAYAEPWSGTLDPGGSTLAASVTVVPAEVARRMRATGVLETLSHVGLFARVRAVGDTLSDTVVSKEFVYPLLACQYCLVANLGVCPYAPANKGNVCNISQDNSVDCCSDGAALVCPARAPSNP
jgi:hypothetical protein